MARAKGSAKGASEPKKRKRAQPKCKGKTKAGKACRNRAKAGEQFCTAHLGLVGRKVELDDPNVQAVVLLWISKGSYAKAAAAKAGSSKSALYRYLEGGEADEAAGLETARRAFRDAYREAEADGELALFATARNAAEKDGRLALEILARRNPQEWGKRRSIEVTGKDGGPVQTKTAADLSKLTIEEREQLLALTQKMEAT